MGYFAGKKGMKHIINGIKENTSEVQKQERLLVFLLSALTLVRAG